MFQPNLEALRLVEDLRRTDKGLLLLCWMKEPSARWERTKLPHLTCIPLKHHLPGESRRLLPRAASRPKSGASYMNTWP